MRVVAVKTTLNYLKTSDMNENCKKFRIVKLMTVEPNGLVFFICVNKVNGRRNVTKALFAKFRELINT